MPNDGSVEHQPENSRPPKPDTSLGPIVLIIIVASILFLAVNDASNASERQASSTASTFDSSAFLSGVDQRNSSADFRGGKAEAFMGGVKLDFRDAIMHGDEARIEVSAIMGGIELRVPRNWTVVNRVVPILGGVEDNSSSRDSNKRLVIEGTVVMGGLDIGN